MIVHRTIVSNPASPQGIVCWVIGERQSFWPPTHASPSHWSSGAAKSHGISLLLDTLLQWMSILWEKALVAMLTLTHSPGWKRMAKLGVAAATSSSTKMPWLACGQSDADKKSTVFWKFCIGWTCRERQCLKASSTTRLAQLRQKKGNMSDMVSGKLLTCTEREIEITCVSFQFLSCSACLCPGSPTMCCRLHKSRLRDEAQASIVDHDGSTMDQQINLHEEKPWKTMKNLQSPRNSTGKPATKAPKALALCGQRIHKWNSKLLESQGLVNES